MSAASFKVRCCAESFTVLRTNKRFLTKSEDIAIELEPVNAVNRFHRKRMCAK